MRFLSILGSVLLAAGLAAQVERLEAKGNDPQAVLPKALAERPHAEGVYLSFDFALWLVGEAMRDAMIGIEGARHRCLVDFVRHVVRERSAPLREAKSVRLAGALGVAFVLLGGAHAELEAALGKELAAQCVAEAERVGTAAKSTSAFLRSPENASAAAIDWRAFAPVGIYQVTREFRGLFAAVSYLRRFELDESASASLQQLVGDDEATREHWARYEGVRALLWQVWGEPEAGAWQPGADAALTLEPYVQTWDRIWWDRVAPAAKPAGAWDVVDAFLKVRARTPVPRLANGSASFVAAAHDAFVELRAVEPSGGFASLWPAPEWQARLLEAGAYDYSAMRECDALVNYTKLLRADGEDGLVWAEPVGSYFARTAAALRLLQATSEKAAALARDEDSRDSCKLVAAFCQEYGSLCEAAQRVSEGAASKEDLAELRKWLWDASKGHSSSGDLATTITPWLRLRRAGLRGIAVGMEIDGTRRVLLGFVVRTELSVDGGDWTPAPERR